jgi:drug/metabolite transporter (DMT)-like permease
MYIFIALLALFFEACDEAIDKIAIVKHKGIDLFAATFWRNLINFGWIAIFVASGLFGGLTFLISWPVVLLGIIFMGDAFFYTYLLKKIEISSQAALSYATPALYLIIDAFLFKLHFSAFQVLAILLLVAGGMLFTVDTKKGGIRKEFTPRVWIILVYYFLSGAVEYYSFKYYFPAYHLNEVSYFFNTYLVMIVIFIVMIVLQNRWKAVRAAAHDHHYLAKVTLSKFFDAAQSCLWLYAIALATVSQVEAVGSFYPLLLVAVVFIIQNVFGYKAEEEFKGGRLYLKIVAVVVLCVGGLLLK